ncbi:MAG: hypothetical protein AAB966_05010, partial [Patescibacteria group bacterium]
TKVTEEVVRARSGAGAAHVGSVKTEDNSEIFISNWINFGFNVFSDFFQCDVKSQKRAGLGRRIFRIFR